MQVRNEIVHDKDRRLEQLAFLLRHRDGDEVLQLLRVTLEVTVVLARHLIDSQVPLGAVVDASLFDLMASTIDRDRAVND